MANAKWFNATLKKIGRLLADERKNLLAGEYAALVDIGQRRQALVEELERVAAETGPSQDSEDLAEAIASVREEAARNQALLQAAMNGFAVARDRLAKLSRDRRSVGTYTVSGARTVSDLGDPSKERRT